MEITIKMTKMLYNKNRIHQREISNNNNKKMIKKYNFLTLWKKRNFIKNKLIGLMILTNNKNNNINSSKYQHKMT